LQLKSGLEHWRLNGTDITASQNAALFPRIFPFLLSRSAPIVSAPNFSLADRYIRHWALNQRSLRATAITATPKLQATKSANAGCCRDATNEEGFR